MKKKYIAPQMQIISGECETHILAGSGGDSGAGSTTGQGGEGGNQGSGGTSSGGSSDFDGQGAKGHGFNIWDDDEEE